MPPTCPDGFDRRTWEEIAKRPLNGTFLLQLAAELSKRNFCADDIHTCLNLPDSKAMNGQPDVCHVSYTQYHAMLTEWQQIAYQSNKDNVGELISCLSKLRDINTFLSDFCCTYFKLKDQKELHYAEQAVVDSYSSYEGAWSQAVSEGVSEETDEAIYSELVVGKATSAVALSSQFTTNNIDNPNQSHQEGRLSLQLFSVDDHLSQLKRKAESLQKKFASLINQSYTALKAKPVPADRLQVYITQRCVDKRQSIPLFGQQMSEIISQSTHEQIFMLMSQIGAWNFLDYSLLKDILDEFHVNINSQLDSYSQEVLEFQKKTKLADYLKVWEIQCLAEERPSCTTLIAKCTGIDYEEITIDEVCQRAKLLAGEFNLHTLCASIGGAASGCLYLLWYIPELVAKHMERIMKSKDRPNLASHGFQQLIIGKMIFKDCGKLKAFSDFYQLSVMDPEYFFGKVGKSLLHWEKPFKKAYHCCTSKRKIEWFCEGKLNVSVNCLDRHASNKTALLWEPGNKESEKLTYGQLLELTCKVANVLKDNGINKGDRVIIYMPAMPLAVTAMLACARMGAVHCVAFSDFDVKSLKQRIIGTQAKCIITANERVVSANSSKPLKENVDKVMEDMKVKELVKHVFWVRRTDKAVAEKSHDVDLDKAMEQASSTFAPEDMDSEDEMFILYTSGTGKKEPRGIVHTQAGYLLNVTLVHKFLFNCQPGDVFGCMADLGWMAGHVSVVYGPLCNGETTVLFEGLPWEPHPGRYWAMVEKFKVTHFCTIPYVLEKLKSYGDAHVKKHNLSSLKIIAVAGEPLPPELEDWYFEVVGNEKCLLIDAWGQTEIGGMSLMRWRAPEDHLPERFPTGPKSLSLFGVIPRLVKDGMTFEVGECRGNLFLEKPIPSMGRKVIEHTSEGTPVIHNFADYYFKEGKYATYDMVKRSGDGEIHVIGRADNSIRIKGVDWMPVEIASGVTAEMNTEIKDKLRTVTFCQLSGEYKDVCAILRPKLCMDGDEKQSIAKDVKAAYAKTHFLLDDDQQLRIFFTQCRNHDEEGIPVTPSKKRAIYSLTQKLKAVMCHHKSNSLPYYDIPPLSPMALL